MIKYISPVVGLIIVNSVFATNSMPPTICDHKDLMQCLNITSHSCSQAMNLSLELCTSNIDPNDGSQEIGEIAKILTQCMSVQFLNQSGLTQSIMEACTKEFSSANMATLKWLEKAKKESDDRFFNEDDPLHNYGK